MKPEPNTIIQGNSLEILRDLPENFVDMAITSPPYWGLRVYDAPDTKWPDGWVGQLGAEPQYNQYIEHLTQIFDEVRRVLKPDGTLWVNIADSYSGSGKGIGTNRELCKEAYTDNEIAKTDWKKCDIRAKSLILIPERLAIALTDRGWILRNDIIWHKVNCMPCSAKDRFTVDHEYLYFFSAKNRYYFEQQFEPWTDQREHDIARAKYGHKKYKGKWTQTEGKGSLALPESKIVGDPHLGRNKRTVWKIPTDASSEAHFAIFPEKLIESPINAGCPQFICKACGRSRKKIYEKGYTDHIAKTKSRYIDKSNAKRLALLRQSARKQGFEYRNQSIFKGYTDCGCGAGFRPGIVLDPFAGRGTTGLVAQRLGRSYLLIEISKEYAKLCEKNLGQQWLL